MAGDERPADALRTEGVGDESGRLDVQGTPAPRSSRLHRAAVVALRAAAVVCIAGLLLRWTLRDAWHPLAFAFYATPPGLVVIGSLSCGTAAAILHRRALTAVFAVTLAGGVSAAVSQFRPGPERPAREHGAIRGMLWNVEHGNRGWPDVLAAIRGADPDVVWIVEGPAAADRVTRLWRSELPGMSHVPCGGHIHVLVRGAATVVASPRLGARGTRASAVRVKIAGGEFETLLCDVPSRPFLDRRPPLDAARTWAASRSAPILVVGDFNTPLDSVAFDAWRPRFRHAWEEAGTGWGPTWPMPVPVLHLDHVWAGPGVEILRCGTGTSGASDHRWVLVEFRVAEVGEDGR